MKKTNTRVRRDSTKKTVSPQVPHAPDSTAPESPGWRPIDLEFFRDMMELETVADEASIECLWRHLDGRLFLTFAVRRELSPGELFREVSYDEAHDWVAKKMENRDPGRFLALHGATRPNAHPAMQSARATKQSETQPVSSAPELFGELDNAIDQSEALLLLFVESHSGSEHGGWNDNIKNGFVHLAGTANDRLRRAHSGIENALKGGV